VGKTLRFISVNTIERFLLTRVSGHFETSESLLREFPGINDVLLHYVILKRGQLPRLRSLLRRCDFLLTHKLWLILRARYERYATMTWNDLCEFLV